MLNCFKFLYKTSVVHVSTYMVIIRCIKIIAEIAAFLIVTRDRFS
jgi:hypothetical protein